MKKTLLTTLIGFVLATSALPDIQDPPANDYGPTRRLGRGFSNLLFASAELSQSVCEINRANGNSSAASYGIVRGLGRSTTRHFAGLFEVLTFPFPAHRRGYRPSLPNGIERIHAASNPNTLTAAITEFASRTSETKSNCRAFRQA